MQNFREAFEALLKISDNNIIHHDMTVVNIFHDETLVLIGDWGLSVDIEPEDVFERKIDFFYQFHEIWTVYDRETKTIFKLDDLCSKMMVGGRVGQVSRGTVFCTILYFLWEYKDTILETITANSSRYKDIHPILINLIKYVSFLGNKEELRQFLKIVMKHSDLYKYIQNVSSLIDITEEQSKYLVDQFIFHQNYDSFYEVLSAVEGVQVTPPEDIIPILEEKRNQIVKIIGPPSQGGARRKKKAKTRKHRKFNRKTKRR